MTRDQFESQTEYGMSRAFSSLNQMINCGDTIYILEKDKGIHVVDVSSVFSPQKLGYLSIPGCEYIQAKPGLLYIQCAVDLVVFDFGENKEVNRVRDIFPPRFEVRDGEVGIYQGPKI